MDRPNIVVIGGSAGALQPLQAILASLPPSLAVAVFVVIHMWPDTPEMLALVLDRAGPLRVKKAQDRDGIVMGTLLVAPPDQHLIIKDGFVRLARSPRENLWRPSIDVLFRSAAVAYGTRVIGVILSGALDDGSSGLSAIKRCGGAAIVQSPAEAQFPDMPRFAVRSANVDYVVPHREIAGAIERIVAHIPPCSPVVPPDLAIEAQFADPVLSAERVPSVSAVACSKSDCRNWLTTGESAQLSCAASGARGMDAALWAAIRHFEHRANVHWTLACEYKFRGYARAALVYGDRAQEAQAHACQLRKLLGLSCPGPR
jgi:two-component system chemotaxis response regulator CheB